MADLDANLTGEGALNTPELQVGWAASFAAEGALNQPELQIRWSASFVGEGSFLSTPDLILPWTASLRGEGALNLPSLSVPILLSTALRGEGALGRPVLSLPAPGDQRMPVGILLETVRVSNVNNGVSSSSCVAQGFAPQVGQTYEVRNGDERLLRGNIASVQHYYLEEGDFSLERVTVTATDGIWRLGRKRITRRFTMRSATDVVKAIVALAQGFTTTNVASGLPTISIAFTNARLDDALTEVAVMIGAQWRVDVSGATDALYFDIVDVGDSPDPLSPSHPTMQNFSFTHDISQLVNKLRMIGAGATVEATPSFAYQLPNEILENAKGAPVGATRLYVDRIDLDLPLHYNSYDSFGNPIGSGTEQPPVRIFTGGTIITGGGLQLAYTGAAIHNFFVGGTGEPTFELINIAGNGITQGSHQYFTTITTEFGESTWRLGSSIFTFSPVTNSAIPNAVRVSILGRLSLEIRFVNFYRTKATSVSSSLAYFVGSIVAQGGEFIDAFDDDDLVQLIPTVDRSERPPQPYIQLESPLIYPVRAGEVVRIFTTVEDLPSQSYLKNLLTNPAATFVDDGIVEDEVSDEELTSTELSLVGQAHLKYRSRVLTTVWWESKDRRTKVGRLISSNMPGLSGEFRIQTVDLDEFHHAAPGVEPTYRATATNRLFTLEHILRSLRRQAEKSKLLRT